MHKIIYLLIPFIFVIVLNSNAQELRPKAKFLTDSAQLGEVVSYSLNFAYPRNFKVIFPDSTYDYSPFELESKVIFKTKSDSVQSHDSVIYRLRSFEIDPLLLLSLPVYIVSNGDSTGIFSDADTLFYKETIDTMPDSISLKENTELLSVKKDFNYPYLLIALGIIAIIAIVSTLLFKNVVVKQFKLYRLKKRHQKFLETFDVLIKNCTSDMGKEPIEKILIHWKSYLEKLRKVPFKKLTTKEIVSDPDNKFMEPVLKVIDRSIYSDQFDDQASATVLKLKTIAVDLYQQELKQLNND